MLYPSAEKIPGMLLWTGGIGSPKAAPGRYTARIRYDKDSADVSFTIRADPNYPLTEADYDAQVGFLLQVRDKYDEVQRAILRIRDVRTQLQALNGRLDSAAKPVRAMSDSLIRHLTAIEEALYQTKSKSSEDMLNFPIRINDKLSGVYGFAASGNAAPSRQAHEVYTALSAQADRQLNRLKDLLQSGLRELNTAIYDRHVPVIGVKEKL
jgi:cell division septum initiation protein DivIVA